MSEKTEAATTYKLKKAKEKGQVIKSSELNGAWTNMMFIACMGYYLPKLLSHARIFVKAIANFNLKSDFNLLALKKLCLPELVALTKDSVFFLLLLIGTILMSSVTQNGFIWSAYSCMPNFQRLNPIKQLQQMFSFHTITIILRGLIKLFLLGALIACLFFFDKNQFLQLIDLNNEQLISQSKYLFTKWLIFSSFSLLLFSYLGSFYNKKKYLREQRMSKEEVTEEHRLREGNPKIKQRLRQIQWQLRQKILSIREVRNADLLITNPTHLAIALKYDYTSMVAPKVVCKASGQQTPLVKKIAFQHAVPIIEDPTLARALFAKVNLNHCIDREFFPMVAILYQKFFPDFIKK